MTRKVLTQPLPMDLRNCSFRGANCEGWDFSGRDIRGCDFRGATLTGANFSKVIAGRSLKQNSINIVLVIPAFVVSFVIAFNVAFAAAGTFGLAVANAFTFVFAATSTFAVVLIGLFLLAVVGAFAGAGAGAFVITGEVAVRFAVTGTVAGAGLGAGWHAIADFNHGQGTEGTVLSTIAAFLFFCSFAFIPTAIKGLRDSTGTNLQGAGLKSVNFSYSMLNNCNFDKADTSFVNWTGIEGVQSTIDFNDTQMELMITRNGISQNYCGFDLVDQHLRAVELIKADLSGADVTRSNLQSADLTFANLSNLKAGDTDFSNATLTGSCIQNWTISSETKFTGLICDYIFLSPDRDPQSRRPLSGSFEPGDFELLVDKFADTLDFILRRGTDPVAFKQSLNQFQQNNPDAKIKAMVDLDADRVLVQATVPEGSDKVKIYEEFQVTLQLKEQEIRHLKGTIDEKDKHISMMDRWFQASQRPIQIVQSNQTKGDLMPDNRTQTQAGGDIISAGANNQGVVGKDQKGVAGRDISGTLTISLAALSETADPKAKELIDLISQVRQAIEAPDSELDDRHKKRALEYLNNLTELAQNNPEDLLKQAKDNLDDLTDIAEKGSELVIFAEKYLPTFTAAIGGLRAWFGI
jgi:uncharacterized protein YjbI with pentapeptide repeats